MNRDLYSNTEFQKLREMLNKEILRRGTFTWWDPLTIPVVGEDTTPPLTIPEEEGHRIQIDENTYTINTPSEGSIERTKNIKYPINEDNPGGKLPAHRTTHDSSAKQFDFQEMKNFLVGLAKIKDINLFYGRDEISGLVYRDPKGIEDALINAQNSELNTELHLSDIDSIKNDPNGEMINKKNPSYPVDQSIEYPIKDGKYYMPSGESDGEELLSEEGIGPNNFYDDYGAHPGDGNYKPLNPHFSKYVDRSLRHQGHDRDEFELRREGGISSSRFGENPRNPNSGNPYKPRSVMGGIIGACNVACFKAGTLIETINGPIPIEEIKVGTEVLTQSGKYHMVYENFERETDDLISIRATGTPIIYTTFEHPFWVKKYTGIKRIDGKTQQTYADPKWIDAKDIETRDKLYLLKPSFGLKHIDHGIAYMVGRWLGDGWKINQISKNGYESEQFNICCSFKESKELEAKMDSIGIEYNKGTPYTCNRYYITKRVESTSPNQKLIDIIRFCGKYAHGKFINHEIFNWDMDSINNLLEGYFDADGSVDLLGKKRIRVTTVSKKLAYGISVLMRMVNKNPSWYERDYPNNKGIIQGREVNMRKSYDLSMFTGNPKKHYSIYEEDAVWASVTLKKIPEYKYTVYNLSVEEDHSYYADGVLVHNCTGLCSLTCDDQCSESCTTTCWNRCGESCTATCGNVCTGCSTLCYTSCKTKCETNTGYACVKAGAKTVKVTRSGNPGEEHLTLTSETYKCIGCSYSCQFYPNKKTQCWDAACMGKCFTTCMTYCSTSCLGGCINKDGENNTGRGCSSNCAVNCLGACSGICDGTCVQACWQACKASCTDNCEWKCHTNCGSGCSNGCINGCGGGCYSTCEGECLGNNNSNTCAGCGAEAGCTATCMHACNKNCVAWGCRSLCGTGSAGACEANCRLNCMSSSCTSLCSNACASLCTACVNTCGNQCGSCTSQCSIGCGANCNITCTEKCEHSCDLNCVTSCTETCGGCSDLCYSCVGMCIGVCSVKCEGTCTNCSHQCSWWCDSTCNRHCFNNCDNRCISTCSGSCATFLTSNTSSTLDGPSKDPTSDGYIYSHPVNRFQQRDSFIIIKPIKKSSIDPKTPPVIKIGIDDDENIYINGPGELGYVTYQTSLHGGVFNINETTGDITINTRMLLSVISRNLPNPDGGGSIFIIVLYKNPNLHFTDEEIEVKLPFGFSTIPPIHDEDDNTIIIIERDKFNV